MLTDHKPGATKASEVSTVRPEPLFEQSESADVDDVVPDLADAMEELISNEKTAAEALTKAKQHAVSPGKGAQQLFFFPNERGSHSASGDEASVPRGALMEESLLMTQSVYGVSHEQYKET